MKHYFAVVVLLGTVLQGSADKEKICKILLVSRDQAGQTFAFLNKPITMWYYMPTFESKGGDLWEEATSLLADGEKPGGPSWVKDYELSEKFPRDVFDNRLYAKRHIPYVLIFFCPQREKVHALGYEWYKYDEKIERQILVAIPQGGNLTLVNDYYLRYFTPGEKSKSLHETVNAEIDKFLEQQKTGEAQKAAMETENLLLLLAKSLKEIAQDRL